MRPLRALSFAAIALVGAMALTLKRTRRVRMSKRAEADQPF